MVKDMQDYAAAGTHLVAWN